MNNKEPEIETRQERREKKLKKKRERVSKHGKNLARVYVEAVLKRLRGKWAGGIEGFSISFILEAIGKYHIFWLPYFFFLKYN